MTNEQIEQYYTVETSYTDGAWVRRDNRFSTAEELQDSEYLAKIKKYYQKWRIVKVTAEIVASSGKGAGNEIWKQPPNA